MKLQDLIRQDSLPPSQDAVLNVLATASWVSNVVAHALAPYGVTPAQYNVLRILRGVYPGRHTCSDVGARLVERTPDVRSTDDLRGLTLAVQAGNTSGPVAERLAAQGRVAAVRRYPYDAIGIMLDDLGAGRIGAVMKLAPVLHWLTRDRPALEVVEEGLTVEQIAVATGRTNEPLRAAINAAQEQLTTDGTLARLKEQWLTP